MKDIFEELIKRYEDKRKEFFNEANPEKPFWMEFISSSKSRKAEDVLEQEIKFYSSFEDDMLAIPEIRNKNISIDNWKEIAHFLTVHNERLSSEIDNSSTLSAIHAAIITILVIIVTSIGNLNWILLGIVLWFSFQEFNSRIEKRHELSRNRELLAIIENHISKTVQ